MDKYDKKCKESRIITYVNSEITKKETVLREEKSHWKDHQYFLF